MGGMRRWLVCWILLAYVIFGTTTIHADPFPDRSERVIHLARAWAKVKFFHPYLAYKDLDWDAAFIAVLPKVEAATTIEAYRAAMKELLGKLRDPVTVVIDNAPEPKPVARTGDFVTTPAPGIVVVEMAGIVAGGWDAVGFRAKAEQVSGALAKSKVAVIDLRAPKAERGLVIPALASFADALPAIDDWPLERSLEHHGYRTQAGMSSGGYFSTFITTGAKSVKPAPRSGPAHVVFVSDATSYLPPEALALQAAGRATIVSAGPLAETSVVTTVELELGAGITGELRVGELLWGPPAADVRVTGDPRAKAIAVAKGLVGKRAVAKRRKLVSLPQPRLRDELDYADSLLPSRAHRVLAGVRAWAVLEYFFPYRYLAPDWDHALRDALPKLEAASDREAYITAMRELGVRAGDGHVNVWSPVMGAKKRGPVPFEARLVEGKLAVLKTIDKKLAVGDVIETIDGKPVATALATHRATTSGSTADARAQRTAEYALIGDEGSTAKLGVRGRDNKLREVSVTRQQANFAALDGATKPAPHWKQLANQIGYVDLRQLTVPEVPKMFSDLAKSRAIVFDMRGYPKGTAWSIAPRVNTKHAKFGAQFFQPLVSYDSDASDQRIRFLQPIPPLPPGAPIYTGKIVVLIDDRAISQSEHTCLFLQETAGATFVGSPTAGANGDITTMRLPGALRLTFTGQEVRHVDGKQLQRVGIQPQIMARPTIAGIRGGKDEVLERALAWLATGK